MIHEWKGISVMLSAIRFGFLIVSFVGYISFLHNKMHTAFVPGFTFALTGSVLFFAGILNVLPETSLAVFIVGLWFFISSIRKKASFRFLLDFSLLFFAVACTAFLFLLHGALFTHYDNFSHWGLVVREMLADNRMPNYSNGLVIFKSYPLGSACFLYYIGFITGMKAEWVQMWSQAVLMAGMLTSLFAFANHIETKLFTSAAVIMLLCGNINFTDLLVDTLLPTTAISATAFLAYYRDRIREKTWYILPWMTFLVSIKNSGILFAVFCLFFLIAFLYRCGSGKDAFRRCVTFLLIFFGEYWLWKKHVELVYTKGMIAKHSLSLCYLYDIVRRKTGGEIGQILLQILQKVFSLQNRFLFLLLFAILLTGWLVVRKTHKDGKGRMHPFDPIASSVIVYTAYMLGLAGMYVFSMPIVEALRLSGYERYYSSILIYISGLLLIAALSETNQTGHEKKQRTISGAVWLALLAAVGLSLSPHFSYYTRQDLTGTPRERLETVHREYDIPPGAACAIVRDPNVGSYSGEYIDYMSSYVFRSEVCFCVQVEDLIEKDPRGRYDYLIALDETEPVMDYFRETFDSDERVIVMASYE